LVKQSELPAKSDREIIIVTYESELAASGGLAAVMKNYPKNLADRESCCTIAPYFSAITGKNEKHKSRINDTGKTISVNFGSTVENARILEHIDKNDYHTYLIQSENHFLAQKDPYINPENPDELLTDSLFFCAAVPKTLDALGKNSNLVLHLQDWETASVAYTIKQEQSITSVSSLLTLHNPYDRGIVDTEAQLINAETLDGPSILSRMIPETTGQLSTVSRNFADELTSHPLHQHVFADHLQPYFAKKGIIGIDNGIFGDKRFPFSEEAFAAAQNGDYDLIRREKWAKRKKLPDDLSKYLDKIAGNPKYETWGKRLALSDPDVPVLFFMGRDDPRQKGYDIAVEAIRSVPPGNARYIFTPMPGDEGFEGLGFLRQLCNERPGEVMVFPFRLEPEPYLAILGGSSYMVMCSLYEPFGGATEAYLAGMPVVARATGGLVEQVMPYSDNTLGSTGLELVHRYHQPDDTPTGFLYRERMSKHDIDGWRKIVDCDYAKYSPMRDRVSDRKGTSLYDEMVSLAAEAIGDAIELYTVDQYEYAEMIYNGYQMLDKFSWDRAITEYTRLYDSICR